MNKSEDMKEKIIETTIELLKNSNGNTEAITIRGIAEILGIGTGLIHYHFGSKEKLIETSVQRIISNVITVFNPNINKDMDEVSCLREVAKQVMDFLFENAEISKVSILGDLINPMIMDNTMKSVLGFMYTLKTEEQDMKLLSFCFTLILQGAFLRKDSTKDTIGYDLNDKGERDIFIDFIISNIYGRK